MKPVTVIKHLAEAIEDGCVDAIVKDNFIELKFNDGSIGFIDLRDEEVIDEESVNGNGMPLYYCYERHTMCSETFPCDGHCYNEIGGE